MTKKLTDEDTRLVLKEVSIVTDIYIDVILTRGHKPVQAEPRFMMYHVFTLMGFGSTEIKRAMQEYLGYYVDHSSVIHGVTQSTNFYGNESDWKTKVDVVFSKVKKWKKQRYNKQDLANA